MAGMSVLQYLRRELGPVVVKEWKSLSEEDKADLKAWASEEMALAE